MTRQEFLKEYAKKLEINQTQANICLNGFFDIVTGAFKKGENVVFANFGKFKITRIKAKMGINPKTQEPLHIPESNKISFKPGKSLKEAAQTTLVATKKASAAPKKAVVAKKVVKK